MNARLVLLLTRDREFEKLLAEAVVKGGAAIILIARKYFADRYLSQLKSAGLIVALFNSENQFRRSDWRSELS